MAASKDAAPTVIDSKHFDADKDAKTLRAAMKGLGTDEKKIIDVVCMRSYKQLCDIQKVYQQSFGRVLKDDLKSELGGKFEDVILALFYSEYAYQAYILNKAIKGLGTDEQAIIEIMCTADNKDIKSIEEEYKKAYKHDLRKDLVDDTSGDFKRLLVSLTSGDRETSHADHGKAKVEAKQLYDAGAGQKGTDEETFNMIFARRSWAQLNETFKEYKSQYKKDIIEVINSEFSGSICEGLKAIAKTAVEQREAYFAECLRQSMKGAGTNDQQLIRLVCGRSQIDLRTVKVQFMRKYKKTLEDWIKDDTSGDYRNALMKLSVGNN